MSTLEQHFGNEIKRLRKERNLTQEELAFRSDIHTTYVSLLERGQKSPSLRVIVAIAKALDTPPSEMVKVVE